ncbi:MAG: hypothetical protein ACJ8AW_31635 [Rhodopila sp.]
MLFGLPSEIVTWLDKLKEYQGLRNQPGAVATDRTEEGNHPEHDLDMRKPALPGGLCGTHDGPCG